MIADPGCSETSSRFHALAPPSAASQCAASFPGPRKNRVVSIVPVLSWVAALAGAAIAIASGPRPVARAFVLDRLLRYAFIFPVGLMGFWAALGHIVFPARAAQAIGWQTSPFQFEVGAANLGIGCAGLYAAFRSFEARLATNLALACFLIGAGIGHIREIITAGNFAPGNARPILFTDLLTPTAIFLMLWLARSPGEEKGAASSRTPARRQG
jgi:hypothetical protein